MAHTHDYGTRKVRGDELDDTHVLVGESGGLSAVYEGTGSALAPGMVVVTTEHGPLYLDPDELYDVLADDGSPCRIAVVTSDGSSHEPDAR